MKKEYFQIAAQNKNGNDIGPGISGIKTCQKPFNWWNENLQVQNHTSGVASTASRGDLSLLKCSWSTLMACWPSHCTLLNQSLCKLTYKINNVAVDGNALTIQFNKNYGKQYLF